MVNSAGKLTQATAPKLSLAKTFLSRSYLFILCSRFRWKLNRGDSAIAATPVECFANVRLVPPGRSTPPDENTERELPASPLTQFLRRR